jgi:hypothetical protein
VLAAIETFHGTETAGIRIKRISKDGFFVMLEEEPSMDRETGYVPGVVGIWELKRATCIMMPAILSGRRSL